MNHIAASMTVALLLLAQDQRPSVPLAITRMSIGPCVLDQGDTGQSVPYVEVRNIGQRTIVAWNVTFTLTYPDGRVGPGRVGRDAVSVLDPDDRRGTVAPGATAAVECGFGWVPATTRISDGIVTAVIFDDDTALGDERQIAQMFDRRRTYQMFWQKMQVILEQATAQASDGAAVLSTIRTRMTAETDLQFKSLADVWIQIHLRPRLPPTPPQAVLDRIRSMTPAEKANADAHAVRR